MLTLVLLAAGVVGVNAGKLYADLSKLGNGPESTWDGATNTITWKGKSNNMISNFNFAAGNYRSYSSIVVSVSDFENASSVRVQVRANGKEKVDTLSGEGTHEKSFINDFGFTSSDLKSLEWIRLLGSSWDDEHTINAENPASAKINSVYLNEPTRTLAVNLSKMAKSNGNATWDFSTKKFAWSLNYSNSIPLPGLSGNLSSFTKICYETVAGASESFRILVYYDNGAPQTTYTAEVGNKTVNFADMGVSTENLSHIKTINFSGASTGSGNVILNSFSLEGPAVNYIEETKVQVAPAGVTDINGMTGADNKKWSINYPLTVGDGTLFGGDIDSDNKSIDLSAYDYLLFVVSGASADAKTGLRVFVSKDNGSRVCLYAKPMADYATVTDWTAQSFITTSGIYVVKISEYPLLRGMKNLAYWQGSAGTITISQAYLGSGSPVAPTESTVIVGEDALNDPNATCFDVTSLPGTSISYNTANPNALFIANSGQVTNTKNVIVDGNCANLVLTDGYDFMAPNNFTATTASYTTTINATAKAGTLCLPFAATLPTGVTAYTLAYTSGDEATATEVTTTIPANTPVLLNGAGAVTFTGSGSISANAENKSKAMTGVFAKGFVPKDSYVLQLLDSRLGFRKVADDNSVSINPFRAYLTAAQGAGSRLGINFGGVTGIETVATAQQNGVQAYDLQGRRVAQPAKGLYIVNGKKYIVK